MASQSLYRKWRSQTFSDLVGQNEVVRTLKNALSTGTHVHAYLFTGPRGTGKTSSARLLAKTINCLHPNNGEPCNECQQCREITAGNSLNVIEIDAASNRGIDSIRELRDKVMMPPITGKYKVYILDEAHMLTTEAFNALLKTLEEPPKHAVFVLATTDVHKMLPTVISRCQRFDFKRITTRSIVGHLNFVATQEQIELEGRAAELIARAAAGGMRDALSLLDQAIAYCGQEISLAQVQAMLGVADPRAIQKFVLHVAQLESAAGLHLIHELADAGADLRQLNNQIAEYWRALMLAKAGADVATILDRTEDEVREILQVVPLFTLEELVECARIFAQNELMQKNQGTPQLGLELALLTCIEVHRKAQSSLISHTSHVDAQPMSTVAAPVVQPRPTSVTPRAASATPQPSRPQTAQAATNPVSTTDTGTTSAVTSPVSPNTEKPTQSISIPPVVLSTPVQASKDDGEELPDWDDVGMPDEEEVPEVDRANTTTTSPINEYDAEEEAIVTDDVGISSVPSLTVQQVKEVWEVVKRRIKTAKDGAKVAAMLNGYIVLDVDGAGEKPVVFLKANADFHYKFLQKDEYYKIIEWALKLEFERECQVKLLPPGASVPTKQGGTPSQAQQPVSGGTSLKATMAATPLQSARVERPATRSAVPPASQERQPLRMPEARETRETRAAPTQLQEQPLARTKSVRENSTRVSSQKSEDTETRKQTIERKAKSDPVVQEAVRLFKAEIKEIQLK